MILRKQSLPKSERGATLLVTLCLATVLAISVASYQTMAYYTLKTGTTSVQNSRAMQMAETGLEEAIYALNNNSWTGWTLAGGNATKTISGFALDTGMTGSASITVTGYAAAKPTMTVEGTVTDAQGTTTNRTFTASTGLSSTADSGRSTLFNNALAAVGNGYANYGNVVFTYNGITVDSYDSSAGAYSSGSAGYAATIAALASGTDSSVNSSTTSQIGFVNIYTATVKGYVATSATSTGSTALTSATGAKVIGSSTGSGIDTARLGTSPYQISQTISAPSGSTNNITAPTSGTLTLGTAGATTPTLYYGVLDSNGNFDIESGAKIEVEGPVYLIIPGNFYIGAYTGSGSLKIKDGGSLQVFVAGYTYISGGGIDNTTLLPKNMAIFGTSTYAGYYTLFYTTQPYYGVVYTPNADVYLYGRSNASAFYGSFVGRDVYVNNFASTLGIHYDTNLRDVSFSGITTPYAVSNVTEQ